LRKSLTTKKKGGGGKKHALFPLSFPSPPILSSPSLHNYNDNGKRNLCGENTTHHKNGNATTQVEQELLDCAPLLVAVLRSPLARFGARPGPRFPFSRHRRKGKPTACFGRGNPQLGGPALQLLDRVLAWGRRAGTTVFPEPIGLGGSFNRSLWLNMAQVISTEARAMHNVDPFGKIWEIPVGSLACFAPNINIFRDPRWGRGQETPGEDPFLTSTYGQIYIRGIQGDPSDKFFNPNYTKIVATLKHFDAYSLDNWEGFNRHSFNAKVSEFDLEHTYFPAFRASAKAAKSVMCSYNAVNSVPMCANGKFQNTYLRDEWGFSGYIVSDCGAIENIFMDHNYTKSMPAAVAVAIKGGCDLDCGPFYDETPTAVKDGLLSVADVDQALVRLFTQRIALGEFDDPARSLPYSKLGWENVNTPESQKLAREAAQQSIVLLKNEPFNDSQRPVLPLDPASLKSVAVIGPNADISWEILGNYHGNFLSTRILCLPCLLTQTFFVLFCFWVFFWAPSSPPPPTQKKKGSREFRLFPPSRRFAEIFPTQKCPTWRAARYRETTRASSKTQSMLRGPPMSC
jgi:beta-glucosidase-like glycosyl hydrolase